MVAYNQQEDHAQEAYMPLPVPNLKSSPNWMTSCLNTCVHNLFVCPQDAETCLLEPQPNEVTAQ